MAIGDLNGASARLREILRGLKVIDGDDRWTGDDTHLIQVGDLFNRGPDARGALLLLHALRKPAAARGGKVTVLLGNHEVMTALGNEMYCTVGEYLSFATAKQRERWGARVNRAMKRLAREHGRTGPILPLGPRLEAWKVLHVPGRAAMRRSLSPTGRLGRLVRKLPIAVVDNGCVYSHSGGAPTWAKHGV